MYAYPSPRNPVYKCQSNFIKKLEANNGAVEKQGDAIDRLRTVSSLSFTFASVTSFLPVQDYDMLIKLYESHTSMYASQATAIQEMQKQQVVLIQGLAPLEPLLKCISPQTENVVLALGARLDEQFQKSRDATERLAAKFEDSNSSLGTVETRLSRLEGQLGDAVALLRRLATTTSSTPQKTPVQNRRKRHDQDCSSPSPQAKRQRIYSEYTHGQHAADVSVLRREEDDPLMFSSTASSILGNSDNSIPSRLRPSMNKARAQAGRRATIASSLRVSVATKLSDSSAGSKSRKFTLENEINALAEPFFARPTSTAKEGTLAWSLRPRKSSAAPSDPVNRSSTLSLDAVEEVTRNSNLTSNSKRRESASCQGKENDALATSSNNGSHKKKKPNSKKARRSTNVPDVSISLRSPTPSPFVPPPPPQTQTQTQTDASQTQTLVPSTGSMVLSTGATPIADPSTAPTREASFLLTFDSSQATSQTFTQVASQIQAKSGTVGYDTPVVGGSDAGASSTASKTHLPTSGTDLSGKLAKKEDILAAALFPEAFGTSVNQLVSCYSCRLRSSFSWTACL